jgi:hypothetical protein
VLWDHRALKVEIRLLVTPPRLVPSGTMLMVISSGWTQADLADLLRAVLYLHFDDVRRVNRTPKYSAGTRTDFVVGTDRIAVAAKLATPGVGERQLAHELEEDVAHYEGQPDCERLIVLICDLEQVLHNPRQIEAVWSRAAGGFDVQCIVGS